MNHSTIVIDLDSMLCVQNFSDFFERILENTLEDIIFEQILEESLNDKVASRQDEHLVSIPNAIQCKQGVKECSICLEECEPESMIVILEKCTHAFHEQCINEWVHYNTFCPTCRCDILKKN